jgi:hypothetical protein
MQCRLSPLRTHRRARPGQLCAKLARRAQRNLNSNRSVAKSVGIGEPDEIILLKASQNAPHCRCAVRRSHQAFEVAAKIAKASALMAAPSRTKPENRNRRPQPPTDVVGGEEQLRCVGA